MQFYGYKSSKQEGSTAMAGMRGWGLAPKPGLLVGWSLRQQILEKGDGGGKRQRGQRGWPQFLATILASIYLNQEFPPAMSAKIMLDNILASSAPASFCDQMCFEVTFTALEPTSHPICWKITYVGSAYNEEFDQTLEEFEIDPIEASGTMKFDIACKAPDASRIPRKELISVTALLITASYREQEFIRVGYYIHNQLVSEEGQEAGLDELPTAQLVKKVRRTIISDKPRVTKFNIQWSDKKKVLNQDSQQSKLSDFFSLSGKSQGEQESSSQKMESKELHQKQSTLEESEIMIAE